MSKGSESFKSRLINALVLMRIPFSVYLMPFFWFGLGIAGNFEPKDAILCFISLHLFAYPSSNGYNSLYDKDDSPIGGLELPPQVNNLLAPVVYVFDALAIICALAVSLKFAAMVMVYLLVSKAYSFSGIRLKKYPILGFLTVVVFQGAFTVFMVLEGLNQNNIYQFDYYLFAASASLMLAGSYPLTQIYQHKEDSERGDTTISIMLGLNGTFTFSRVFLIAGTVLMLLTYGLTIKLYAIPVVMIAGLPPVIFFERWAKRVKQNPAEANFKNTMMMNKISSLSLTAGFIVILMMKLGYL